MSTLEFRVHGLPAPQGSKRHVGNGVMIESSARVRPWRQDVKYAALDAHAGDCGDGGVHFDKGTPISVEVTFFLPRPKGHYRAGANAHLLRDAAPTSPTTKPDLDKLLRSTLDAIGEAGIWADDSQVVRSIVRKVFADGVPPGALVSVKGAAT